MYQNSESNGRVIDLQQMYSDQLLLPSNLFVPQASCALRPVEHKIMCRHCESIAPICAWKARKSFESYCAAWECDEADDEEIDDLRKLRSSSPDLSDYAFVPDDEEAVAESGVRSVENEMLMLAMSMLMRQRTD